MDISSGHAAAISPSEGENTEGAVAAVSDHTPLKAAEAWLDGELDTIHKHRSAQAQKVCDGLLEMPLFSSAVFDTRLAAPTYEIRELVSILPERPSPAIVEVPLDTSSYSRGNSVYSRELSAYDQQKSNLTSGKSGREGDIATRLEFLPGGLTRPVSGSVHKLRNELSILDEIALKDPYSEDPYTHEELRRLADAGLAPGLSKGLDVEDVKRYLNSIRESDTHGIPHVSQGVINSGGLDKGETLEDDSGDIDNLSRNHQDLLGRYDGVLQDPEFKASVRANLQWEGTKERESRVGDTVSFANIFADLDEEDYLLGSNSSSSDSASDVSNEDIEELTEAKTRVDKSRQSKTSSTVALSGEVLKNGLLNRAEVTAVIPDKSDDFLIKQGDNIVDEISALILETEENLDHGNLSGVSSLRSGVKRGITTKGNKSNRKWAHTEPVPLHNFHTELVPNMAMRYPFELDAFQKQAVLHLERGEYVFVAAHTSAGKTVVAEYAIALAFQHRTRVVYTSPIKALSNQKFRDFREKFDDVGIITGDVSVNPDATCLVMTTEILRSMLYRGADLVRDIEWVVFDEVHYVNDTERGVVWEEVIIMLPQHVKMIFLSATTPNMVEFSEWIGRTKQRPVHVISTPKRPVPLEHSLYHDKKRYVVMDSKGTFLNNGYRKVANLISGKDSAAAAKSSNKARNRPTGRGGKGRGPAKGAGGHNKKGRRRGAPDKSQWTGLIRMLENDNLLPAVIFSFSKKVCMGSARVLQSMDLTTAKEKSKIHVFCQKAILRLGENDRSLPQVTFVLKLLRNGIGVHTGGLLPIVKEIVEIMFSRGLVRVLFATETFAMGVNMPTRTVVFNGTRKHDGVRFRDLLPGEYTQMSGRAGRRGLDSVGTVLIAAWGDKLPEVTDLHHMLKGKATKLSSQFRLTYTMILTLLRVEDMSVEEMIKRSFSEFSTQHLLGSRDLPQLADKIRRCLEKLKKATSDSMLKTGDATCPVHGEDCDVEGIFNLLAAEAKSHTSLLSLLGCGTGGPFDVKLIPPGRLVIVRTALPGRILLSNSPAVVIQTVSSIRMSNAKSAGKSIVVCALCPKNIVLPDDAIVHDMTDASSFMPGSYKRITDKSLGGGSRILAMLEISHLKLLRICESSLDAKELIDETESNSSTRSITESSRKVSSKTFGSSMVMIGKKKIQDNSMMIGMMSKNKRTKKRNMSSALSNMGSSNSAKSFSQKPLRPDVAAAAFAKTLEGNPGAVSGMAKYLVGIDANLKDVASLEGSCPTAMNFQVELKIKEIDFVESFRQLNIIREDIEAHASAYCPQWSRRREPVERERKLREKLDHIERVLSDENLDLFPDFVKKLNVLQALEYTSQQDNIVQLKGRVACEVNTCDELILTELVFENVLENLSCEEAVAILSAFVFQQRTDDIPELNDNLNQAKERLIRIAQSLAAVQMDHGLKIDPVEYVKDRLNFGMVHVVYEWARGVPFSDICELTAVEEGTIVRCITRLDETCREVRNIARVIGDPGLYQKMEAASNQIKRDIVFATSLYL